MNLTPVCRVAGLVKLAASALPASGCAPWRTSAGIRIAEISGVQLAIREVIAF